MSNQNYNPPTWPGLKKWYNKGYCAFTTAHYEAIAKLIRDNTYVDRKGRPEINTLAFLMDMCKTFKEDNEGFREEMFLKACGVTKE